MGADEGSAPRGVGAPETRGNAYSPLKATRHLDIVQKIREGVPARPAHVQLIVSDLCDMSCDFCAYRNPLYSSSQRFFEVEEGRRGLRRDPAHPERNYNPNRMIPIGKALEIIADCASMGVSGIQLTGGGEPTVHPDFKQICAALRNQHLAYAIVSNGALILSRELVEDFAAASWVRVSVDAGSAEDYARIRHVSPATWGKVWAGIAAIRARRDRNHLPVVIGVGYVVTPDNWQGVYEGVRLAREAGADNVRISAYFSERNEDAFHDTWESISDLCRRAVADFDGDGFEVVERFGDRLEDLRLGRPDYARCCYQQLTTYIGADLTVYRCCVYSYNDRGVVGSLKEQRFRDLWTAPERTAAMEAFDARGCERCQFNELNRGLGYMLAAEHPLHWEFV